MELTLTGLSQEFQVDKGWAYAKLLLWLSAWIANWSLDILSSLTLRTLFPMLHRREEVFFRQIHFCRGCQAAGR